MGLKSKLNKMKSFLFDEEDEENASIKNKVKEKIKKKDGISEEVIKKDKKEEKEIKDDFDDLYFEDISEIKTETSEIKSRVVKNENEFRFPEFNDDDFMVSKKMPEPVVAPKKEEKVILYQGSKRKEETKKFKPSPIISPIYGLLDNDGNIASKDNNVSNAKKTLNKDEASLDAIRKKAYGNLDAELESTLKKLNKKTIEEAEKDMEAEEKEIEVLSRTKQKEKEIDPIVVKNNEEDDMILPNVNFKEIDVDLERNKNKVINNNSIDNSKNTYDEDDDDDDDTKEQDLFHLIDTMYSEKEDKD